MAHTLEIANAVYPDVPSISVPISGGGTASYIDTSDGDAVAEDVASGKICYSNGARIVGTGSGGGGGSKYGLTIDDMLGDVDGNGQLLQPTGGDTNVVFTGVTKMVTYALYYKFYRNTKIRTVSFPALTTLNTNYAMQYAFDAATNITSASFPLLATVTATSAFAYVFYGCTGLKSVSLPELTTVSGSTGCQYLFYGCTNLETVSFPKLKTIGNSSQGNSSNNRHFYNAFYNCNKLTTLSFPELTAIYCNGNGTTYGSFASNNKVQKLYFPKLATMTYTSAYTNANKSQPLENMFASCTALAEIHFALTNKTAVEAMTGYSSKWGAPSNCQVLFDL